MELIARNLVGRLRATFTGPDGEAIQPVNPRVTITRDSDGATVADNAAASLEGEVAIFDVPPQPGVDLLFCEWVADGGLKLHTTAEVVGGWLAPLVSFPGDTPREKRAAREAAERRIEDAANVAFRPRYAHEVHTADGATVLLRRNLARRIISVAVDGEALPPDAYKLAIGGVLRFLQAPPRGASIDVRYEHGYTSTPEPVSAATVKLAHYVAEGGDDRITRFREDDQEFFFALPGSGSTPLPEVNQIIADYGFRPYVL